MKKIVVDSGCDISDEIRKKYDIEVTVIPLTLTLGDESYIDDANMNVKEYIESMEASPSSPKSSSPSPQLYLEAYKQEGSVFVVTLSAGVSGSYDSAMLAKEMYREEYGEKFIHVFDSASASVGETLIALKINELVKAGYADEEIVESVNRFIRDSKVYYLLENFNTAVKNGRMKPYVATIASLLSIQIIGGQVNGKMDIVGKARGYKKAVMHMIELIQKHGVDLGNRILGISHCLCPEKAISIKNEILKKIKFADVILCETSGLCSTYAAKNGVIISF